MKRLAGLRVIRPYQMLKTLPREEACEHPVRDATRRNASFILRNALLAESIMQIAALSAEKGQQKK